MNDRQHRLLVVDDENLLFHGHRSLLWGFLVADILAFDKVYRFLGDIRRVVAYALQGLRYHDEPERLCDGIGVLEHVRDELAVDLGVEVVDEDQQHRQGQEYYLVYL